ncbi:MAG: preprotein translocase subunit SecG [Myxococcota bacterium]
MQTLLYVLHFIVCFILIAVVLLQRGKGQDLGASLGGGGANTIFGSRGAGNFLTRITTASAIIFMGTSLSLSYLGYKSSDVRLFDESEPFVPAGAAPKPAESTLEELPADSTDAAEAAGGLVEIPAAADEAGTAAADAPADAVVSPDAADAAGAPSTAAPSSTAAAPAEGASAVPAPAESGAESAGAATGQP